VTYLVQRSAANTNKLMEEKKTPEMIWVMLLQASPTGTHEVADSANNGPWGKALTMELIPYLEKKYRMEPRGLISPGTRHQISISTKTAVRACSFAWAGETRNPLEIWLVKSVF